MRHEERLSRPEISRCPNDALPFLVDHLDASATMAPIRVGIGACLLLVWRALQASATTAPKGG